MYLKLSEKEADFLKRIEKKLTLNDKNNIAYSSPIHVVYIASEQVLDMESDPKFGVIPKYKINENVFENIEEIKCLLKENVFENLFKNEKNEQFKSMFYLDSKSELFSTCVVRPQGFKEFKSEIMTLFEEIDSTIFDFDSVFKYVLNYYEKNDFYLENFPKSKAAYETIYYEVITVPYALFNKKTDAKKCVKQLEKKGVKATIESYATKNNKNDLSILRQLIFKLIQGVKEEE